MKFWKPPQGYTSNIDVDVLGSQLCKKLHEAEEVWLDNAMRVHFPGVHSLVSSYQPTAAMRIMKAQGIHLAIWPSGKKTLRCHNRDICSIDFVLYWDGHQSSRHYTGTI